MAVAVFLLAGCGEPISPGRAVESRSAVCAQGAALPAGRVTPNFETTGPTSNAIRRGDGALWIVESGSNTVSKFDLEQQRLQRDFIDVGEGRNPYDIAIDPAAGRAFVTNWLKGTVSIADTQTGRVLDELSFDGFDFPQGVAVTDDYLYITNVHFRGGNDGSAFDAGTVSIIDRDTLDVVDTVETTWKNPQYIRAIETPHGPRIALVSAGVITTDGALASDGGLELWEPYRSETPVARTTHELPVVQAEYGEPRIGGPGRPLVQPNAPHLYFTSATAPAVFKFDLESLTWVRGTDDPIELYDSRAETLHHGAFGPDGLLWVTAFNRDSLYVIDPACDDILAESIPLGTTDALLEGPHGLQVTATGETRHAYYIMSRANALGRLRFDP
jgi:hypothetical protein